jgi:hypothetical protein
MGKKDFIVIIIGAVIILLLLFNSNLFNTNYDGQVFSFDYPNNWEINDSYIYSNATVILLVPKNGSNNVEINLIGPKSSSNNNTNLNNYITSEIVDVYNQVYPNDNGGNLIPDPDYVLVSNKSVNINGLNGFDMVFKVAEYGELGDPHEYTEEVILKKGDNFYEARLNYSPNATTQYFHNDFMKIVESLQIN